MIKLMIKKMCNHLLQETTINVFTFNQFSASLLNKSINFLNHTDPKLWNDSVGDIIKVTFVLEHVQFIKSKIILCQIFLKWFDQILN